jgi:hypothetical protein
VLVSVFTDALRSPELSVHAAVHESAFGTKRTFAAPQQFGRYRTRADIGQRDQDEYLAGSRSPSQRDLDDVDRHKAGMLVSDRLTGRAVCGDGFDCAPRCDPRAGACGPHRIT